MRFAHRFRLDVMAALLAIATSVLAVCPCLPPPAADAAHSCCPGDESLALRVASPDCCDDHAPGGTAVVASAISLPTDASGAPACAPIVREIAGPAITPVPFVPDPPLVLRI